VAHSLLANLILHVEITEKAAGWAAAVRTTNIPVSSPVQPQISSLSFANPGGLTAVWLAPVAGCKQVEKDEELGYYASGRPEAPDVDDQRQSKLWALYFQDEFQILKNLILNAGVRHDQYETFGGTTNPRIALIYNPFQKTAIKLLYGEAFRPPSVGPPRRSNSPPGYRCGGW
jgi:outer membrane receptor protein involved in Fe transport